VGKKVPPDKWRKKQRDGKMGGIGGESSGVKNTKRGEKREH